MTSNLGIDVGGTKTRAVLLSADGVELAESVRPTRPGADGVIATALAVTDDCCRLAGISTRGVASIGVGIPGVVDPSSGRVRTAVNLEVSELDLGPRLAVATAAPVTVENDVKCAALGACEYLGAADLTYLNFGTGVAAAAVVHGAVIRGRGNVAGEIGHLPVDPSAELCNCGQRGCLEVLAGGGHLANRLAAAGLDLAGLVAAADAGDLTARAEADRLSAGVATAVQVVVLTYGSPTIVLGGGVIQHAAGLLPRVRRVLAERAGSSEFISSLDLAGRLAVIPSDHPVAAVGAALIGRAGVPRFAETSP